MQIWHFARIEAFNCSAVEPRMVIGDGTRIHPFVHLAAAASVVIGRDCLFASNVYVTDHDHDLSDPAASAALTGRLMTSPVTIGDEVWVGEGAKVLKGVTIGRESVVAAGAVVAKDVPPRSVVAGVPARLIRTLDERPQAGSTS